MHLQDLAKINNLNARLEGLRKALKLLARSSGSHAVKVYNPNGQNDFSKWPEIKINASVMAGAIRTEIAEVEIALAKLGVSLPVDETYHISPAERTWNDASAVIRTSDDFKVGSIRSYTAGGDPFYQAFDVQGVELGSHIRRTDALRAIIQDWEARDK